MFDVYKELAIDLLTCCELGKDQADAIVKFLDNEGLIDYDNLKEYYAGLNEED